MDATLGTIGSATSSTSGTSGTKSFTQVSFERPIAECGRRQVCHHGHMSVQFLKTPALRLHPDDDVVIVLRDLAAGVTVDVDGARITANVDVPAGHKMAVRDRAPGDAVHRYAQVIGTATAGIVAGDHVHSHNLAVAEIELDHEIGVGYAPTVTSAEQAMFQGIRR
jgi:altronate hydrolase